MSFAIQFMSAKYLADNRDKLSPGVIAVPEETDLDVAMRKLRSCGLSIDALTPEQKKYLSSWQI